jgi:hypothetical protein
MKARGQVAKLKKAVAIKKSGVFTKNQIEVLHPGLTPTKNGGHPFLESSLPMKKKSPSGLIGPKAKKSLPVQKKTKSL